MMAMRCSKTTTMAMAFLLHQTLALGCSGAMWVIGHQDSFFPKVLFEVGEFFENFSQKKFAVLRSFYQRNIPKFYLLKKGILNRWQNSIWKYVIGKFKGLLGTALLSKIAYWTYQYSKKPWRRQPLQTRRVSKQMWPPARTCFTITCCLYVVCGIREPLLPLFPFSHFFFVAIVVAPCSLGSFGYASSGTVVPLHVGSVLLPATQSLLIQHDERVSGLGHPPSQSE